MELEKAQKSSKQRFLRLAGAVKGPANLSIRNGFSRNVMRIQRRIWRTSEG
jgi:hypothetical protein